MTKSNIKTSALLSAALVASMGLGQAANADTAGSLFAATDLDRGYMAVVGEGKCGEGKCGGDKNKKEEGKKEAEGKCGEGKCGGDKSAEGKKAEGKKGAEGKCGEGKCGSV